MKRYHVTYYYLATGMEGRADEQDYGEVDAEDSKSAKLMAARLRHPTASEQDIAWIVDCLTAEEVK